MKIVAVALIIVAFMCASGCRGDDGGDDAVDMQAARMQQFVIDLAAYARSIRPNFIIIPQNGAELVFNHTEPADGLMQQYVNVIDGIGVEELFYDGDPVNDPERLDMLRTLGRQMPVMVADYVGNSDYIEDAVRRSTAEGFISFPREPFNYDYAFIPPSAPAGLNANDVWALADAQNYLYLISPDRYSSKQALIRAIAATDYDVVLIDPFFNDALLTTEDVGSLKTKANGGERLLIAYVNVGAAECWRYYWQPTWCVGNPAWLKKAYDGYPDEVWVAYWDDAWRHIIFGNEDSYIKKVLDAGFDGAYLDNVEAYYFLGVSI